MAIKEYKLGDISFVKNGTKNKEDQSINGKYNFYVRSKNILKSNDWTINGNYTIIPGEGVFYPLYNEGKASVHQRVYYIKANNYFIKDKYLYYWWLKNNSILYKNSVGTTVKSLRMNNFTSPIIRLPNLEDQQEIINIIEPFEKLKVHLLNRKNLIIKLLNDLYLFNSSKNEKDILSFASLYNKKYQNQISYIETSNIDENFSIINNIKTIQKDKKPSRANLTPREDSLIFSKLIGSNKLFPIYDKKYLNYVYSTGFYNISSNDLDWYLFGFLNSDDFIKQKNNNSSGTLMEGITINGLKKIKIKLPKNNYHLNSILHLISKHNIIIKKIDNIISHLINLYIV